MAQRVGQYELVRRIGSGGMAEVWMGRRASVGGAQKSVAIKLMAPRVAADERHRRMFLAEARLSMLMTHSNVVQVFDAGEDEGRLYLVMEWIDGLNLAQLCELRRREGIGPWPPRLCAYVIGEVLRGLAYAHRLTHEGRTQCVVHRDVSPHNVLVSTSGEVKIADFGVARLTTEETSGVHIKGKLRYMAPEHLAGRSREPTVDLYGVGAVLHELLAGTRFREEADEVDLYGQILGGHVPPLAVAGVPPELASLREGLLQAEPRQRIPTAARALEYLAAWAGYRNASDELGALCRSAMGVVAPRSGIESTPTMHTSVDPEADTQVPSAPGPTADAATRTSAGEQAATRTSGPVPIGGPRPSSGAAAQAGRSRPMRRRALLVGAGIVGVGFSVGGIAVAWLRRPASDEPGDDASAGPASGAGGGQGSPAGPSERDGVASAGRAEAGDADALAGDGGAAASSGDAGAEASDAAGASAGEPRETAGTSTGAPSSDATSEGAAEGDDAAGEPEVAEPAPSSGAPARRKTATVELRLRPPLRVAYVRIGGGKGFAVDPKAERTVPAGRPSVWWRKSADAAWRDGGRFTFEANRRYTLRLTESGPVLE